MCVCARARAHDRRVTVDSAGDLPVMDFEVFNRVLGVRLASCDAYVVLKLGQCERKTEYISNSLNPVWGETFEFIVHDPEVSPCLRSAVGCPLANVSSHTLSLPLSAVAAYTGTEP